MSFADNDVTPISNVLKFAMYICVLNPEIGYTFIEPSQLCNYDFPPVCRH